MIVTLPVIHEIKRLFPHVRVEVVASPRNVAVIENDPAVDEIHLYVKNILKDWPLIRRLKRKKFDIIYDAICLDSITGLLLARLISDDSYLIAARKKYLQKYYHYCKPHLPDGTDHNIDNGLLLLDAIGVERNQINPYTSVFIPADSRTVASRFFDKIGKDKFIIGINISAGSRTRTLKPDKYKDITDGVADAIDNSVVVISCTMDDREIAEEISRSTRAVTRLVPENLSFLDAAACISHFHIFVSPDTSLLHVARLMKIPVVGMYSNHIRNFNSWRPYGQKHGAVISSRLTDIHDITPDQVIKEFRRVYNDIKTEAIERE
jgi:ADP-heptose:LPS heptosyltransferase